MNGFAEESRCPLTFSSIGGNGCYCPVLRRIALTWLEAEEACQNIHSQAHLIGLETDQVKNTNIILKSQVPMSSGGSKGGARDARFPRGSKCFQFHAVFGKIWQNRMLAPPRESWRPLLGEILDPPLMSRVYARLEHEFLCFRTIATLNISITFQLTNHGLNYTPNNVLTSRTKNQHPEEKNLAKQVN